MVEDKTNGIFRILYDINGEGIEITCAVCGTYSAGADLAKEKGNSWRIPVQVLEKTPYVCKKCGTEYAAALQDDHWHLFMNIPKELINKKAVETKLLREKIQQHIPLNKEEQTMALEFGLLDILD